MTADLDPPIDMAVLAIVDPLETLSRNLEYPSSMLPICCSTAPVSAKL